MPALSSFQPPEWLTKISADPDSARESKLPLEEILTNSLYYPACELDGTPIKSLSHEIQSFVYADYSMTLARLVSNLQGNGASDGIRGYAPVLLREVFFSEFVPSGWKPEIVPSHGQKRLLERERSASPFGHWSVWKRLPEFPDTHGAEVISLLYLGGEMSAVYQGLYLQTRRVPKVLALIQPGGGMGGGWETPDREDSFFHRVVRAHPEGMPSYLLHGGLGDEDFYRAPCWSEYGGDALKRLSARNARLWGLVS